MKPAIGSLPSVPIDNGEYSNVPNRVSESILKPEQVRASKLAMSEGARQQRFGDLGEQ
jgi:hypothetical protein